MLHDFATPLAIEAAVDIVVVVVIAEATVVAVDVIATVVMVVALEAVLVTEGVVDELMAPVLGAFSSFCGSPPLLSLSFRFVCFCYRKLMRNGMIFRVGD